MSAVLEVGPHTVRMLSGGSGRRPPAGTVEAALDWIDDAIGLLEDRPVRVAELWRTVTTSLLGSHCESVMVVHPDNWTAARIDRVVAAANAVADRVETVACSAWNPPSAVEVAAGPPPGRRRPSRGAPTLAAALTLASALAGAVALGAVVALLGDRRPDVSGRGSEPDPRSEDVGAASDTRIVAEGRVAVRIPRRWSVARVTEGEGSRRIQADASDEPGVALHITQSYAPGTTLSLAADVLARAIADEPSGVFVDFQPDGQFAGRPAVTYREVRPGRVIDWSVVIDGATRVGIGCQSPHGREAAARPVCEEAVRSAREHVGTHSRRRASK